MYAGILAGIWPCSVICIVSELFVSESFSQVYRILHEFLSQNSHLTSFGKYVNILTNMHVDTYTVLYLIRKVAFVLRGVHSN